MVKQIDVLALAELLRAADPVELYDVRTPLEWATASIEGAIPFDEAAQRRIASLPLDTPLLFLCHHGIRSQHAAAYYASHGYVDVTNVEGGIDAWSLHVDPGVPRY